MDVLQRLEELERRVGQMVVRGKIAEVDPVRLVAKVEYGPGQTTGWLQWKPLRSGKAIVWWCPEVGEGATVISEGDLSLGEIFPGSYHKDFQAPSRDPELFLVQYGDGATMSYDRAAHLYRLTLPAGGRVELVAPAGFKLTGDTEIDGALRVTKDTSCAGALHVEKDTTCDGEVSDLVRSMSADRELYNVHNHPTPDGPEPPQ